MKIIIFHRYEGTNDTSVFKVDVSKLEVNEKSPVEKAFYEKLIKSIKSDGDHGYLYWSYRDYDKFEDEFEDECDEFDPQSFYLQNDMAATFKGFDGITKTIELIE